MANGEGRTESRQLAAFDEVEALREEDRVRERGLLRLTEILLEGRRAEGVEAEAATRLLVEVPGTGVVDRLHRVFALE
jgi:hypothetical protein